MTRLLRSSSMSSLFIAALSIFFIFVLILSLIMNHSHQPQHMITTMDTLNGSLFVEGADIPLYTVNVNPNTNATEIITQDRSIIASGASSACSNLNTQAITVYPNPYKFPEPGWNSLYFNGYSCPRSGVSNFVGVTVYRLIAGYDHVIMVGAEYTGSVGNMTVKQVLYGKGNNIDGALAIDKYDNPRSGPYWANTTYNIRWGSAVRLHQIEALLKNRTVENNQFPSRAMTYADWNIPTIDEVKHHYFSENNIVQNIHACYLNSFLILKNGEIYGFGSNRFKSMGLTDENFKVNSPTRLSSLESLLKVNGDWVDALYCGYSSVVIITKQKRVIVFGRNDVNQLGLGLEYAGQNSISPMVHPFLTNYIQQTSSVKTISFGLNFTAVLFHDGSVYCAGLNLNHQCGLGISDTIIHHFTQIPLPLKVVKITTTAYALFLGTDSGDLYVNGANVGFVLGLGIMDQNVVVTTPTKIPTLKSADFDLSTGYQLYHIIYQNATAAYAWGSNQFKQLSSVLTVGGEVVFPSPTIIPFTYIDPLLNEVKSNNNCRIIDNQSSNGCNNGYLLQRVDHQTGFNTTFGKFRAYCSSLGGYYNHSSRSCSCYTNYNGHACHEFDTTQFICNASSADNFANRPNQCYCGAEGYYGEKCQFSAPIRSVVSFSRSKILNKFSASPSLFDFSNLRSGTSHSMMTSLLNKQRVYVFGSNNNIYGQFGNGIASANMLMDTIQISVLLEKLALKINSNITSVFAMDQQSVVLFSDGSLYQTSTVFVNGSNIQFLANNVKSLFCSQMTCFYIDTSGALYGVFDNQFNQLGLSDYKTRGAFESQPVMVSLWKNNIHGKVARVYPSNTYTLFVNQVGTVFGIGANTNFQLGLGHNMNIKDYIVPLLVDLPVFDVKNSEQVVFLQLSNLKWYMMGKDLMNIDTNEQYLAYPTFMNNTLSDGEIIVAVRNDIVITKNRNGIFTQISPASKILSQENSTTLSVAVMGNDILGIVVPTNAIKNNNVCLRGSFSLATDSCVCDEGYTGESCNITWCDNDCAFNYGTSCIGPNICAPPLSIPTTINELNLFGQPRYISSNGDARSTGIFLSNVTTNIIAHATGETFSVFLQDDFKAYSLGENTFGMHGIGGASKRPFNGLTSNNILLLPLRYSGETFKSITSGSNFVVVLTANGRLYAAGDNTLGQLGLGDTIPRHFLTPIDSIATSKIVVIYSWGDNTHGQCCNSSTTTRQITLPTPVDFSPYDVVNQKIVLGHNATIIFTRDGGVIGCGKVQIPYDYGNKGVVKRLLPFFNVTSTFDISQTPEKYHSTMCIKNGKTSETWYCFGKNKNGCAGFGNDVPLYGLTPSIHYGVKSGVFFFTQSASLNFYYNSSSGLTYFGSGSLFNKPDNMGSIVPIEWFNSFGNLFETVQANDKFGFIITKKSHCYNRGTFSTWVKSGCSCNTGFNGPTCEVNTYQESTTAVNRVAVTFLDYAGSKTTQYFDTSKFELLGNLPYGFNTSRNIFTAAMTFSSKLPSTEWTEFIFSMSSFSSANVTLTFLQSDDSMLTPPVNFVLSVPGESDNSVLSKNVSKLVSDTQVKVNCVYTVNGNTLDTKVENQWLKVYVKMDNQLYPDGYVNATSYLETEQKRRILNVYSVNSITPMNVQSFQVLNDLCSAGICSSVNGMISEIRLHSSFNYSLYPIFNDDAFKNVQAFKSNSISSIQYPIHQTFNFRDMLNLIDLSSNMNLEQSASYFDTSVISYRNDIFVDLSDTKICDIPFEDYLLHPSHYDLSNTNIYCMLPSFNNSWCKTLTFRKPKLVFTQFFDSAQLSIPLDICNGCSILNCLDFLTMDKSRLSYYFNFPNGTTLETNDFGSLVVDRNDERVNLLLDNFKERLFLDYDIQYLEFGLIYKYDSLIPSKQQLRGTLLIEYYRTLPNFKTYPYIVQRDSDNVVTLESSLLPDFLNFNDIYCSTVFGNTPLIQNVTAPSIGTCIVRSGVEDNQNITVELYAFPHSNLSSYKIGEFRVYVLNFTLTPNIIQKYSTVYPTISSYGQSSGMQNFLTNENLEFRENDVVVYRVNTTGSNLYISYFNSQPITLDLYKQSLGLFLNGASLSQNFTQLIYNPFVLQRVSPLLSFDSNVLVSLSTDRPLTTNLPTSQIQYRCFNTARNESFVASYSNSVFTCNITGLAQRNPETLDLRVDAKVDNFNNGNWFTISSNGLTFYHVTRNMNLTFTADSPKLMYRRYDDPLAASTEISVKLLIPFQIPESELPRFKICWMNSFGQQSTERNTYTPVNVLTSRYHAPFIGYNDVYICGDGIFSTVPLKMLVLNSTSFDMKPLFGFENQHSYTMYMYHYGPFFYSDSLYSISYACALRSSLGSNDSIYSNNISTINYGGYYMTKCTFSNIAVSSDKKYSFYLLAQHQAMNYTYGLMLTVRFITQKTLYATSPFVTHIPADGIISTNMISNDSVLFTALSKPQHSAYKPHVDCLLFDVGAALPFTYVPLSISPDESRLICEFKTFDPSTRSGPFELSLGSYIPEEQVLIEISTRAVHYTYKDWITFQFSGYPILEKNNSITMNFNLLPTYKQVTLNYSLVSSNPNITTLISNCDFTGSRTCSADYLAQFMTAPVLQQYQILVSLTNGNFIVNQLLRVEKFVYNPRIEINNYIPFIFDCTLGETIPSLRISTKYYLSSDFSYKLKINTDLVPVNVFDENTQRIIQSNNIVAPSTPTDLVSRVMTSFNGIDFSVDNIPSTIYIRELYTAPNIIVQSNVLQNFTISTDVMIPQPINNSYALKFMNVAYPCTFNLKTFTCPIQLSFLGAAFYQEKLTLLDGNTTITKIGLPLVIFKKVSLDNVQPTLLLQSSQLNTTVTLSQNFFDNFDSKEFKLSCAIQDGNYSAISVGSKSVKCNFNSLNLGRKSVKIYFESSNRYRTANQLLVNEEDVSKDFEVISPPKIMLDPQLSQSTLYYTLDTYSLVNLTIYVTNTNFTQDGTLYDLSKEFGILGKDKLIESIQYLGKVGNDYKFQLSFYPSNDYEGYVPFRLVKVVKSTASTSRALTQDDYVLTQVSDLVLTFIRKITTTRSIPSFGVESTERNVQIYSNFNFLLFSPDPSFQQDGKVTFNCKYDYKPRADVNIYKYTSAASIFNNEAFECLIKTPDVGEVQIDLFVSKDGTTLPLNINPLNYIVLDGLFLQPTSYGLRTEINNRHVSPFKVSKYATLSGIANLDSYNQFTGKISQPNIAFTCEKQPVVNDFPTLNCTLPIMDVATVNSFQEYEMKLYTSPDMLYVSNFSLGWVPTTYLYVEKIRPLIVQKSAHRNDFKKFNVTINGDSRVLANQLPQGNFGIYLSNTGLAMLPSSSKYSNLETQLVVQTSRLQESVQLQYVNYNMLTPIIDIPSPVHVAQKQVVINNADIVNLNYDPSSKRGSKSTDATVILSITNNLATNFMLENGGYNGSIQCFQTDKGTFSVANITSVTSSLITFTCSVTKGFFDNTQIYRSSLEVWYLNDIAENGAMKISSSVLSFLWLPSKLMQIDNVSPYAFVSTIGPMEVTLNANYSFVPISEGYSCLLKNPQTGLTERQIGIYKNSKTVSCPFNVGNLVSGVFTIQISFTIGSNDDILTNSMEISFIDQYQTIDFIQPFVSYYLSTAKGSQSTISYSIPLNFIPRSLSCIFQEGDIIRQIAKVSNRQNSLFDCSYTNDGSFLSGSVMTSLAIDLGGNQLLNISSNAVELVLYTQKLTWEVPTVVEQIDLNTKFQLHNYYIPTSKTYNLTQTIVAVPYTKSQKIDDLAAIPLECDPSQRCKFDSIQNLISKVPSYMASAIRFTNNVSNRKSFVTADDVVLFVPKSEFNISHISPFVADYRYANGVDQQFLFASTSLNAEDFQIMCEYGTTKANMTKDQKCVIKPQRDVGGNPLKGNRNVILTWMGRNLYSTKTFFVTFNESFTMDPVISFFEHPTSIPLNSYLPVPFTGSFDGYIFEIGIYDKQRLIGKAPCTQPTLENPYLNCTKPHFDYKTAKAITTIPQLLINSQLAFRLRGDLILYNKPTATLKRNYIVMDTKISLDISGSYFYSRDVVTLSLSKNLVKLDFPARWMSSSLVTVDNVLIPSPTSTASFSAKLVFGSGATVSLPSIYPYDPSLITIDSFLIINSQKDKDLFVVSADTQRTMDIALNTSNAVINSFSCKVKFDDGTISSVLDGTIYEGRFIETLTPLMWYHDLIFPRIISFSVSIDDGFTFITSPSAKFSMIEGTIHNIQLSNYLFYSDGFNTVQITNAGFSSTMMELSLLKAKTSGTLKQDVISMKCTNQGLCKLDWSQVVFTNSFDVEFYEFDRLRVEKMASSKIFNLAQKVILLNKNMKSKQIPITLSHKQIQQGASTALSISLPASLSNGILSNIPNVYLQISCPDIDGSVLVTSIQWTSPTTFIATLDHVPVVQFVSTLTIFSISFDALNYIAVANDGNNKLTMYQQFSFTITNQYQKSKASTFASTPFKITFLNALPIDDSLPIKFKISSSNYPQFFTPYFGTATRAVVNTNARSTSMISQLSLTAPAVSSLLTVDKSMVRFPSTLSLGISILGDDQYVSNELVYDDSIADPPVIVSVVPMDLPILDEMIRMDIKASSIYPNNTFCIFRPFRDSNDTYVISANFIDEFSISCSVNTQLLVSTLRLENSLEAVLSLKSNLDESRESVNIPLYKQIRIDSFTPLQGLTTGQFQSTFYGNFPIHPKEEVYLASGRMKFRAKFGSRETVACSRISSTIVTCNGTSNPVSEVDVFLSRNTVNFVKAANKFTYIGCGPGYEQASFAELCKPCQPGFYKNYTGGPCIACDVGHYTSTFGSTYCTKCPSLQTTQTTGAVSVTQCGCPSSKYYYNVFNARCESCPKGATCSFFNTTYPTAQAGYWHSNASGYNPYNFYECIPSSSCGEGQFENCTEGYTGFVCGLCQEGYYRNSRSCQKCSALAPLFLAILIGGVAVIAVIFFMISSVKVHHISSLSIALFFFQVNSMWTKFDIELPTEISGLFAASAASTFNFDFIQFQCVFPIGFVPQWILKMCIPIMLLALFVFLYGLGELRNLFAKFVGQKIPWKKWDVTSLYNELIQRNEEEAKLESKLNSNS
ncbi:hypothetical protein C9374_011772 [Naegleria lovaniensis]|uniref:EGF-like domain-containing protein n=1 Tax=Naegleria lovaniensis TaxID=51637 RepID=A0AA88GE31_NAELO|nr:uncharacterized protein C9374_011772 [Naegleria lovaniensis]KAG2373887.1 hypothetical protein C9374_011772 [Naegleria lovaniensis]